MQRRENITINAEEIRPTDFNNSYKNNGRNIKAKKQIISLNMPSLNRNSEALIFDAVTSGLAHTIRVDGT
jgi:hypothetical protein